MFVRCLVFENTTPGHRLIALLDICQILLRILTSYYVSVCLPGGGGGGRGYTCTSAVYPALPPGVK
jgi:hypothetical protein